MALSLTVSLGVDMQFSMVETVITALNDAHVMASLSKPAKAGVVCALMCLFGLIFVTRAGLHWLELFDSFACNVTLFIVGGLECVAVGWVYGADRFAADTLRMTKRKLPRLLLWNVRFVIPTLLLILTIWTLISSISGGYSLPPAGVGVGWLLSSCALMPLFLLLLRHSVGPLLRLARARPREGIVVAAPRDAAKAAPKAAGKRVPKEVTPGLESGEGAGGDGGSEAWEVSASVMEQTLPSPHPAQAPTASPSHARRQPEPPPPPEPETEPAASIAERAVPAEAERDAPTVDEQERV